MSASRERTDAMFALDNLDVFAREGATVERSKTHAGCRVTFENGWALSIQWGLYTYSDNHDGTFAFTDAAPDSTTAECAAWKNGGDMLPWSDGDTVAGWLTMSDVQGLLDAMARDEVAVPIPGRRFDRG